MAVAGISRTIGILAGGANITDALKAGATAAASAAVYYSAFNAVSINDDTAIGPFLKNGKNTIGFQQTPDSLLCPGNYFCEGTGIISQRIYDTPMIGRFVNTVSKIHDNPIVSSPLSGIGIPFAVTNFPTMPLAAFLTYKGDRTHYRPDGKSILNVHRHHHHLA